MRDRHIRERWFWLFIIAPLVLYIVAGMVEVSDWVELPDEVVRDIGTFH